MARETVTIGGNSYLSNVSLADADEFLAVDAVFGTAWAAEADSDTREKFLVAATRRLDLLDWAIDLDTDTIPTVVKNATALMAAEIQAKPKYAQAGSSEVQAKRIQAGKVSKENFRSSQEAQVPLQSRTVYSMILPYLTAGQDLDVPTGCNGGSSSQFGETHQGYGLTNGYS